MAQWYNTGSAMPPILTFEIKQKQISKSLACLLIFLYLCNAFEMQLRVWAAAQQRPSKLASALTKCRLRTRLGYSYEYDSSRCLLSSPCTTLVNGKSDEDAAFIDFYHVTNHMFAPTS